MANNFNILDKENVQPARATALVTTVAPMNNNAGALVATITNSPKAGNPTKWIPINDNGTTLNIPAW